MGRRGKDGQVALNLLDAAIGRTGSTDDALQAQRLSESPLYANYEYITTPPLLLAIGAVAGAAAGAIGGAVGGALSGLTRPSSSASR